MRKTKLKKRTRKVRLENQIKWTERLFKPINDNSDLNKKVVKAEKRNSNEMTSQNLITSANINVNKTVSFA